MGGQGRDETERIGSACSTPLYVMNTMNIKKCTDSTAIQRPAGIIYIGLPTGWIVCRGHCRGGKTNILFPWIKVMLWLWGSVSCELDHFKLNFLSFWYTGSIYNY